MNIRYLLKYLVVICIVIGMTSCSTIVSKSLPNSEFGRIYSGVTYGEQAMGCNSIITMFLAPPFSIPFVFIPFSIGVVDIGLSALADTILLPIDLMVEPPKSDSKGCRIKM